ncbi:M48 family metallopeptidase [Occallatibacter riparius]|uniref:M48 family metallopeptidase n=1 Tax=Occallatibacter riparius TaxID=1002689 RepID=A0A9J7BKZ0_9BACT|nr:M48 family metallopeptidase [Occallatibacter riparius]UWZ82434.1 M48 family metallopeptidase [Occallatibacter riparius]
MTTGLNRSPRWAGTVAGLALALTTAVWSQSAPPSDQQTDKQQAPAAQQPAAQQPSAQQPAAQTGDSQSQQQPASTTADKPAPGTQPVAGDVPAPPPDTKADKKDKHNKKNKGDKDEASAKDSDENVKVDPDKVVEVGSEKQNVKPGSKEDVNAVGNREIGGRGMGNWYSTDSEIKMGKGYASEIEKSTKFITDPVITEYVNRVGQNIVKNSDCKVPFTIKIIDSDEINAMALPGGFFYVNSGLILNADEEAEMAGVMAHEVAHVCAHHAAREMTRMNYTQIGMVPLMIMLPYTWTGYGIYEATQLAIPIAFLKFSRDFEAEADYLGVQYMYRAGYDPQAFISFFEKVQALEKRKPGLVAKAFSDHPQTPDRILHSQEEIARILPAKDEYTVTTSEFDDVKARLARIENKRRLTDTKDKNKPSLRRASTSSDPNAQGSDSGDDRPTLHRREDQQQ